MNTPKEAVDFLHDNKIPFFRLVDQAGRPLLGWNLHAAKGAEHLKKLSWMLVQSKAIPDGVYSVEYRQSTKSASASLPVQKGEGKLSEESAAPAPVYMAAPAESVRSYAEALADKQLIASLQTENKLLRERLEELTADDAEEGLEEEEESLTGSPITDRLLSDYGIPLLDRYFDLKERELELLSARQITGAEQSGAKTALKPAARAEGSAANLPTYQKSTFRPTPRPAATTPPGTTPVNYPGSYGATPGAAGGGGGGWDSVGREETNANDKSAEEKELIAYIQQSTPEELAGWITTLESSEDAATIEAVKALIAQLRPDLNLSARSLVNEEGEQ